MRYLQKPITWVVKFRRTNRWKTAYGPRPKHLLYGFIVKATHIRDAIRKSEILFWRRVTRKGFFLCSAEEIAEGAVSGTKRSLYKQMPIYDH